MSNNFWTIENDGPGVGNALNGLQIQAVSTGTPPVITAYHLMNGSTLLKSSTGTTMPIHFHDVEFVHRTWDLTASLPFGPSGPLPGNGQWAIKKPGNAETGDNGEFTAQAGTGPDPEAASSANA